MEQSRYATILYRIVCRIRLSVRLNQKIESILAFELDDRIPIDIEEVVYDYRVIKQLEGSIKCLVAFARGANWRILGCAPRGWHRSSGNRLRSTARRDARFEPGQPSRRTCHDDRLDNAQRTGIVSNEV